MSDRCGSELYLEIGRGYLFGLLALIVCFHWLWYTLSGGTVWHLYTSNLINYFLPLFGRFIVYPLVGYSFALVWYDIICALNCLTLYFRLALWLCIYLLLYTNPLFTGVYWSTTFDHWSSFALFFDILLEPVSCTLPLLHIAVPVSPFYRSSLSDRTCKRRSARQKLYVPTSQLMMKVLHISTHLLRVYKVYNVLKKSYRNIGSEAYIGIWSLLDIPTRRQAEGPVDLFILWVTEQQSRDAPAYGTGSCCNTYTGLCKLL